MKDVIFSAEAPAAIGPYSQAIRAGGVLYLSGQIGMESRPAASLFPRRSGNSRPVHSEYEGGACRCRGHARTVVKTTVFLTDMRIFRL